MATTIDLPHAIRIGGQASKRGLIPRMPAGERLLADIATWLAGEYPDHVRVVRQRSLGEGTAELQVRLHPAAPEVTLIASDTGAVTVTAETGVAGPGYHRFVGRVLQRLATEQGVTWAIEGGDDFAFADRAVVERAYLGWLGPMLAQARSAHRQGASGVHLGTPFGTSYTFDGAIATALGPRDDAWLERAIADPRVAIEVTPWWSDATDSTYHLNRALALLWLEVRWRKPAIDGEAETLDEVHRLLSHAYPLDPGLPYPWQAWAEVIRLRAIDDGMSRQVLDRARAIGAGPGGAEGGVAGAFGAGPGAAGAFGAGPGGAAGAGGAGPGGAAGGAGPGAEASAIGYRRRPVTIEHEGWTLPIPGDFAERRREEEWWGGGAGRSVTLAATSTGAMPAGAFLAQVAGDLGPEALTHEAGELRGRARITSDASSGLEVGVLDGFSAVTGSGAAIRIVFDDPADWQWALDLWRSLTPA